MSISSFHEGGIGSRPSRVSNPSRRSERYCRKPSLPCSPSVTTSMPHATWRPTTSETAPATRASKVASSTWPFWSRARMASSSSCERARLPTCVVRMRSSLRFMAGSLGAVFRASPRRCDPSRRAARRRRARVCGSTPTVTGRACRRCTSRGPAGPGPTAHSMSIAWPKACSTRLPSVARAMTSSSLRQGADAGRGVERDALDARPWPDRSGRRRACSRSTARAPRR